ncbi:MAG: hypothetical protein LBD64_00915, partial [Odoribacteraceae bacterium]|nr:hypothetical protein [Odoribacteraceae bacterium]
RLDKNETPLERTWETSGTNYPELFAFKFDNAFENYRAASTDGQYTSRRAAVQYTRYASGQEIGASIPSPRTSSNTQNNKQ